MQGGRAFEPERRLLKQSTVKTYISDAKRVEKHYGDLDELYAKDHLAGVLRELKYSADDERRNAPNPSRIPINPTSLSGYRTAVTKYREYRKSAGESAMTDAPDSEVCQIVREVHRLVDLDSAELGDEFFPAHLSIALIDAIFTPRLNYYKQVVPIIERYCRRFMLCHTRTDRARLPLVDDQETLTDLIAHYEALGPGGVQEEIVKSRYYSPGTRILKSESVRRAAVALRSVGIETIQDVRSTGPEEIKCALRPLTGIGDRTIHMFLMYSGGDEFVKGDIHVCRFVAKALGRRRVPAGEAERLVGEAARALGMAPRLLDYEIWKLGAMSGGE